MSVFTGVSKRVKLAGAVTLVMLVSGGVVASSAAASNVLTLRAESTTIVAEPGSKAVSLLYLFEGACTIRYQAGTLESNQNTLDKLSVGGATSTECGTAGYAITGGKLKSVTATAAGVTNLVFSPALKLKEPGPCYYSFSKMSGPYLYSKLYVEDYATGTLIKAGSIPGCAPEQTSGFGSNTAPEPEENVFDNFTTETQLSSYHATAQVQLEEAECGTSNGNAFIGSAKFTRSSSKSSVTVVYKVKGAPPNTVFVVGLWNTTGLGPYVCEDLGLPVNKTTKTSTFTTNAKGEGSFTGVLTVPRNDTEFFVTGEGQNNFQVDDSLRVSLP